MTPLVSCFDEAKEFGFSYRSFSFRNELSLFLAGALLGGVGDVCVQLCAWYTSSSRGCRDRLGAGEEAVAALQPVLANYLLVLPKLSGSKGCVTSRA